MIIPILSKSHVHTLQLGHCLGGITVLLSSILSLDSLNVCGDEPIRGIDHPDLI